MRAKEIREMSTEDLVVKCKELKEELFNLKVNLLTLLKSEKLEEKLLE